MKRPKLTYANVVATLALFIAVGGASAFAAGQLGKNSVGPKQLRKNAVTGAKVKNHSLTGNDIRLSSLGTVPQAQRAETASDAGTLQGSPASAFVHGQAQVLSARRDLKVGDEAEILSLPGLGALRASCGNGISHPELREGSFEFVNGSAGTLDQTLEYGMGTDSTAIAEGESIKVGEERQTSERVKMATRSSPPTVATLDLSSQSTATPADCAMFVQVIISN